MLAMQSYRPQSPARTEYTRTHTHAHARTRTHALRRRYPHVLLKPWRAEAD